MIYGSSQEVSDFIRDKSSRGLFRTSLPAPGTELPLLPYNDPATAPEEVDCKRVRQDERNFPCFTAGEIRVNEQLGLLAMHTVWFREHNRIAERLGDLNDHWTGERVFQETRKIVGAQIQHVTYTHWLPKILGPAGMQLLGAYAGYRSDVSAAIANSFASATLRMGHSTIFPVLRRLNSSFETIPEGDLNLHEAFFASHRIFDHGGKLHEF
jgi:peroxidase